MLVCLCIAAHCIVCCFSTGLSVICEVCEGFVQLLELNFLVILWPIDCVLGFS